MRRRRALIIAGYWLLQAAAIYIFWPVFFDPRLLDIRTGDWASLLQDSLYLVEVGAVILGLTVAQAAFVRPVHPPRLRRDPTSRPRRLAACCSFLHHLVSAAGLAFVAALAVTFTAALLNGWDVLEFGSSVRMAKYTIFFGVFAAVTLTVTPLLRWRCRDQTPVWISIVIAGFATAAMTTALALALVSLVEVLRGAELGDSTRRWAAAIPALLSWLVATPLLFAFARRGPRDSQLSRLASLIFLGTVIEAVAVLPLDIVVRRKSNCYCEQGTFWALTLLGSVGLFALGPAVYLLPMGRRRKRWTQGRCEVCGYDMRATPNVHRCPECGSGWRSGPKRNDGSEPLGPNPPVV